MKVILLKGTLRAPKPAPQTVVLECSTILALLTPRVLLGHLLRYHAAELLVYHLELFKRPLLSVLLLRLFSRGSCEVIDDGGRRQPVTISYLAGLARSCFRDWLSKRGLLNRVGEELSRIEAAMAARMPPSLDLDNTPVYLRTDLWFGVVSGGSIGHIAGVLNNLDKCCNAPVFLTTDVIPTVRRDIETHMAHPDNRFHDFRELPALQASLDFHQRAQACLAGRRVAFIYQRYSLNNFSGISLAHAHGVPFVLEYNGSEVWINRNWGTALLHEGLSERIELVNLRSADLIVVVSRPMKDELIARGIDPDAILVNPNGVDPERYSPAVDGNAVRNAHGLGDTVVLGFIGTFGMWHGAEVLADAFGRLLQRFPQYRRSVRLLMIGDGLTMPQVRAALTRWHIDGETILCGRVPQAEGPKHLAACDILVSPHVPNPDGTPFFGSPTKLFEYMAMGKGIVASDLDQIGEVLDHDRTAWMVKPGDPESLMHGLRVLIDDPERRRRLGAAARQEVLEHYTWEAHTRRIIERLKERCP